MGWLADLLEQIPSAAYYKIQLEKFDSEYKILKAEHERVKSENSDLQAKLEDAHNEIDGLKKEAQKKLAHGSGRPAIPEIQTRMMTLLASQGEMSAKKLTAYTGQGEEAAKFHLGELLQANFVAQETRSPHIDPVTGQTVSETVWSLAHEGRRYLIQRGLLK